MKETDDMKFERLVKALAENRPMSEEERAWLVRDVLEMNRHLPDFRE